VSPTARLTAEAALARLRDGNARFVAHREIHPDRGAEVRVQLAEGQHPFAVIVGCADSRVPPEILFDEGLGDLFVVRNAGNIIDTMSLASVEYAVAELAVSLVLVLGHERCGVVTAAVELAQKGGDVPGHLWSLIDAVHPAIDRPGDGGDDVLDNVVRAHVANQVARLRRADPIVSRAVRSGTVHVVGARYDIDCGQVELLT
jgi:carbonic anhydrase